MQDLQVNYQLLFDSTRDVANVILAQPQSPIRRMPFQGIASFDSKMQLSTSPTAHYVSSRSSKFTLLMPPSVALLVVTASVFVLIVGSPIRRENINA